MPRVARDAGQGDSPLRRQHDLRRDRTPRGGSSCSTRAPESARSARRCTANGVREVDLLLTHLHLDHVEGFGFFAPLFDPNFTLRIWGPRPDGGSLRGRARGVAVAAVLPAAVRADPGARSSSRRSEPISWLVAGLQVTAAPVRHRGRTIGYRLAERRALAGVHSRQRAGARPGLRPRARRATPTCCSTTRSTPPTSTRRASAGGTRALPDFATYIDRRLPGPRDDVPPRSGAPRRRNSRRCTPTSAR